MTVLYEIHNNILSVSTRAADYSAGSRHKKNPRAPTRGFLLCSNNVSLKKQRSLPDSGEGYSIFVYFRANCGAGKCQVWGQEKKKDRAVLE